MTMGRGKGKIVRGRVVFWSWSPQKGPFSILHKGTEILALMVPKEYLKIKKQVTRGDSDYKKCSRFFSIECSYYLLYARLPKANAWEYNESFSVALCITSTLQLGTQCIFLKDPLRNKKLISMHWPATMGYYPLIFVRKPLLISIPWRHVNE